MKTIYLDNNATTRVDPLVFEEMAPYFCDLYGNPSSMHNFGGQVGAKITEARERVSSLLGATPAEIIFTSCGTEADNTAIRSALESQPEKKHIITTKVEHPAVLNLSKHLVKKGSHLTQLGVDLEMRKCRADHRSLLDRDRDRIPHRMRKRFFIQQPTSRSFTS